MPSAPRFGIAFDFARSEKDLVDRIMQMQGERFVAIELLRRLQTPGQSFQARYDADDFLRKIDKKGKNDQ